MKNFIQNRVIRPIFGTRREVQRLQAQLDARAELYRLSRLPAAPLLPRHPKLGLLDGGGMSTDQRGDLTVVEPAAAVEQYTVAQYLAAVRPSPGGAA